MEPPKKIMVDMSPGPNSNRNHLPADYYTDSDDDFDYDTDRYTPTKPRFEPVSALMTPPGKLTLPMNDELERNTLASDNHVNQPTQGLDASMSRASNDTFLRNMNSFTAGDPISTAKQIRHLHNRVRLLEDEFQTQHNRQIFIIGVLSFYFLTKGVNWMYR